MLRRGTELIKIQDYSIYIYIYIESVDICKDQWQIVSGVTWILDTLHA